MLQSVVFKTGGGNTYLHSPYMKQVILLHPVTAFLVKLNEQGSEPRRWLEGMEEDSVTLDSGETVTRNQLEYYVRKYEDLVAHGYLQPLDSGHLLSGRLNEEEIEFQLANCQQMCFEVTEACNLDCHYCGYGKFYNRSGVRNRLKMDWQLAANMLDYMKEYWNSNLNASHQQDIHLSFYGGEPLMNFQLVRKAVEYAQSLPLKHNRFAFSMTTNGTLLDKHMDFLVKHGFTIHISLDGNENHNGYRVFTGGQPCYETIEKNVDLLRDRYPDYFRDNVFFLSVLHNKNSVGEVLRYFKQKYDKRALIVELNTSSIAPEHKEEFRKTYQNYRESVETSCSCGEVNNDFFRDMPDVREANLFLTSYGGSVYRHLHQLLHLDNEQQFIPTATCLPFGRKIFVTAAGGVMPCERIDQKFSLGRVDKKGVTLDFEQIAARYNGYFDRLAHLCERCYKSKDCGHCLFYLPGIDGDAKCSGCANHKGFSRFLGSRMSTIEEKPELFSLFMEGVNIT